MTRCLICLAILFPMLSCAQEKGPSQERVLELCQYIPDHGLRQEAKEFMTPEFFNVLSEAFDAPVVDYGEIGDNEWLWYFVTGNGGSEPYYGVKEVSRISKDEAHSIITVRDSWEGQIAPVQSAREYKIVMKRQDGKWLLDDFDDKKLECTVYIKDMRKKYESGELLKYMELYNYFHEYIPHFKNRIERFYDKYGR